MTKGADAFRSIGEVAKLLGVAPHVLRYWETQFSLLRPMKRPDGRRYYRPDDVRLAAGLCTVLRDEGLTIRGAKMLMARDRGAALRERGSERLAPLPDAVDEPGDQAVEADLLDDLAADPEPVTEDEADPVPSHGPRARHRRRPHAHGAHDLSHTGWLGQLVAAQAHLRPLASRNSRLQRAKPALEALRDVLLRIC